ncbi:MAG: transcription termination factor NusA, partial [Bacilli bacterium]|nr:transcription termination factor NusA [Bacilli bacterium]
IVKEKNISADVIYEALQLALQTAYKKNFDSKTNVRVDINRETGKIKVFSYMVVVDEYDDGSEVEDEEGNITRIEPTINRDAQILLEDARKTHPSIQVGETIEQEVTPKDFGRVAAGTAKQVVMQKIREAEKASIIEEFADKEYELMLGMVAMEDANNYYIDLGRTRGILPKNEIIPDETIVMGSNIKVYVTKVENGPKGPIIKLSRKHYGFVKRLFEHEIPELANGTILLQAVVREPGIRSKVAVYSTNEKVDPIGACIGEKGSRIAGILEELGSGRKKQGSDKKEVGERVDLVLYNEDPVEYIKNAMVPAKDVIVSITDEVKKTALVIVNEDNLSLAIGKKGSNIKLASRLTKYHLEVKTMEEINKAGNQ